MAEDRQDPILAFLERRLNALEAEVGEIRQLIREIGTPAKRPPRPEKGEYVPPSVVAARRKAPEPDPNFVFETVTTVDDFVRDMKAYRLHLDMSAKQVGDAALCGKSTILSIEAKTKVGSRRVIEGVAKVYQVTLIDVEERFDHRGMLIRAKEKKPWEIRTCEDEQEPVPSVIPQPSPETESIPSEPGQAPTATEPTENVGKRDKRSKEPEPGFVFEKETDTACFTKNLKNYRLHAKTPIAEVCAFSQRSDKLIYAMEAGTAAVSEHVARRLAELYKVTLKDADTFWKKRHKEIGTKRGASVAKAKLLKAAKPKKTPEQLAIAIEEARIAKEEKSKAIAEAIAKSAIEKAERLKKRKTEKLAAKLERQRSDTPLLRESTSGKSVGRYRKSTKDPATSGGTEENAKAIELMPHQLKYRSTDPGHGLRAYVTRNYRRLRIVVKGVCTQRYWDFEETMAIMHEELEGWVKREQELDFFGDNERFMAWAYELAKGLRQSEKRSIREKIEKVEEAITSPKRDIAANADEELRNYMKVALGFKPQFHRVVFECYVYSGKPLEEAARVAGVPMQKAAGALRDIRADLASNFGTRYANLIRV